MIRIFNLDTAFAAIKSPNMPYVTHSRGVELKKELSGTDSDVITPDDEEYAESIKRFSESCEREAVQHPVLNHSESY